MSLVVLVATESRDLYQSPDCNNLVKFLGVDWRELVFGSVPLLLRPDEETFKIHLGQVTATSLVFRVTCNASDTRSRPSGQMMESEASLSRGQHSTANGFDQMDSSVASSSRRPGASASSAIIGISLLWQCPPRLPWHRLTCLIQRLKKNVEHALREKSSFLLSNVIDEFIQRQGQMDRQMHLSNLVSICHSLPGYRWHWPVSVSSSIKLLVSKFGCRFVADVLTASLISFNDCGKQKLILSSVKGEQLLVHFLFVISRIIELMRVRKVTSIQADTFDCVERKRLAHSPANCSVNETIVCDNSFDSSTVVVDQVSFQNSHQYSEYTEPPRLNGKQCSYAFSSSSPSSSPPRMVSDRAAEDKTVSLSIHVATECGRPSYIISRANTCVTASASPAPSTSTSKSTPTSKSQSPSTSTSPSWSSSTSTSSSSCAKEEVLPGGRNFVSNKATVYSTAQLLDRINFKSVCALHVDHLYKVSLIDATSDNCCHESTSSLSAGRVKRATGSNSHPDCRYTCCLNNGIENNCCFSSGDPKSATPILACRGITKVPRASPSINVHAARRAKVTHHHSNCRSHPFAPDDYEDDDVDEEDSVFLADKAVKLDPVAVANQLVMREAARRSAPLSSPSGVSSENGHCPLSAEEESLGYFSSFSSSQGSTAGNEVACTEEFSPLDQAVSSPPATSTDLGNTALLTSNIVGVSSSMPSGIDPLSLRKPVHCNRANSRVAKAADDTSEEINSSRGFLREYRDLRFNKPVPTPPPSPVANLNHPDTMNLWSEPTGTATEPTGRVIEGMDLILRESSGPCVHCPLIGASSTLVIGDRVTCSCASSGEHQSTGCDWSPASTVIPVEERDGFLQMYLQDHCDSETFLCPSADSSSHSSCRCSFASCDSNYGLSPGRRNKPGLHKQINLSRAGAWSHSLRDLLTEEEIISKIPSQDYLQPHYLVQGVICKRQRDISDLIGHLSECSCMRYPASDVESRYRVADLDAQTINPPFYDKCKSTGGSFMQDTLESIVKLISLGLPEQRVSVLPGQSLMQVTCPMPSF